MRGGACVGADTRHAVRTSARIAGRQRRSLLKYKIALRQTAEGYSVSVPGLPGCWSQGSTEEGAVQNIQDAIQEYLAARNELLAGAVVREIEVAS